MAKMNPNRVVWLASFFLLFIVQVSYANTSNTVANLKATITAQQIQLSKQAKALQKEQQLLNNLSKRVDSVSSKPGTSKPQTTVIFKTHVVPAQNSVQKLSSTLIKPQTHTTNAGFVRVRKIIPANQSIRRQAAAPENIVSTAEARLILGTKKAFIALSGQISAVGFQAADGKFNRTYLGTNTTSDSRINIDSKMNISPNLKIGSQLQLGFDVNPSNAINQFSSSSSLIDIRRAEFFLSNKQWGTVMFGQGETASDNTAYDDLSGTKIAGRSSPQDIGGGLYFNGVLNNPQVKDVFNSLDGFGRRFRLLYDTPAFHGFELGGSLIAGSHADVALKYGNEFAGTKIAAEMAYTSPQAIGLDMTEAHGNELNGSASVLFPVGISLTGAGGKIIARNPGRNDPNYYYMKPGFQFSYFKAGLTALSIDFGRYFNFSRNGYRATAEGVQAVQNINQLDLAVYTSYRHFILHDSTTNYHDINLFVLGALYKF